MDVGSILRVGLVVAGAAAVLTTLVSALRTFVLPRAADTLLSRLAFLGVGRWFRWRASRAQTYEEVDRAMELFAPVALLVLIGMWLILVTLGYGAIFHGLGVDPWTEAVSLSGSSLFTLGTTKPESFLLAMLAFSEAALGLGLIALLIAYLPTMYAAFSRREAAVALLEVRAGSPPTAITMIERYHRLQRLEKLSEVWVSWETWFADVEESHTSLAPLAFFRSPLPRRSWVTAAGAVLDGASLTVSALDVPHDVQADLCIRAGYLALRHIATYFRIPFDPDPSPQDPISVRREEFDAALQRLADIGVPLKADRDQAWEDFAGWRVNYDRVLLALARLTLAPYAPWSSDRSFLPPVRATAEAIGR